MKNKNSFLLVFFVFLFLFSCDNNKQSEKKDMSDTDFIYLESKKFRYKGEDFFPIMLNYSVNIRKIDNEYVIASLKDYEDPKIFEGSTSDSALIVLRGHLQLIKELGFNTIRLIGFDRINSQGELHIRVHTPKHQQLKTANNYQILFNCLNQFLTIAEEMDLKVMLLLNGPVENPALADFTVALLKEFKDNSTIFAYDFINEPLYFDNSHLDYGERGRTKKSAFNIVNNWKKMMEKYAPNQLMTIGYSEPIEVFEWDPSILPVDFMAFHTYHPLRVPNEIYWYSQYIDKPWMIGETSLPADNDSITYNEQRQFLKETYRRIVDCGGAGIGWWGFQDVSWGNYEHNFTSIMNHSGQTKTKDGKYTIKGTLKPVAFEFANLKKYKKTDECHCMVNYYNMIGYKNFVIKGKVINSETDKPIEGAVIRGWSKWWDVGANTFTDAKGEFTLYSNKKFENFAISAPGMSLIKFGFNFEYELINKNSKIVFDDLKDVDLEYHSISYSPFLVDKRILDTSFIPEPEESYIFNFKKEQFNKAIFETKMEVKELEPIDF